MSNNGRYTLCPYYRDEKNKSISCEDTFRTFSLKDQKKEWMDLYCDKDWEGCPYAQELNEMYEAIEKGDEMAEENHKIEALQKELKNLASKLGRAEKQHDKDVETIKKKAETIEDLREKKNRWESRCKEEHKKLMNAYEQIDYLNNEGLKRLNKEIEALLNVYEVRMAYFIYKLGGKVREKDIEEWGKDKECAIRYEVEDEEAVWKVVERDVAEKK